MENAAEACSEHGGHWLYKWKTQMGSEIETAVELRSIAVLHLCMQVCFRSLGSNFLFQYSAVRPKLCIRIS